MSRLDKILEIRLTSFQMFCDGLEGLNLEQTGFVVLCCPPTKSGIRGSLWR